MLQLEQEQEVVKHPTKTDTFCRETRDTGETPERERPPQTQTSSTMTSSGNTAEMKVVIVGDGGCGKTSLLLVFTDGDFPETYAPSVFEKHIRTITEGGRRVRLNLYDTAGQDDYDRLRPLAYQEADVILVCYDVTNPTSFENVLMKWFPEVKHFCGDAPLILIGCKTDLRNDDECTRKLRASASQPITYSQGEDACRQMNAEVYLECSAKFKENVDDIFKEASRRALIFRRRRRRRCLLL